MKSRVVVVVGVVAVTTLAVIGGWFALRVLNTSTILDIRSHCGLEKEKQEVVRGQVVEGYDIPLTDYSVFQLKDDTSSIWVLSHFSAPPEGVELRVTGRPRDMRQLEKRCAEKGLAGTNECRMLGAAARFLAGSCLIMEDERE